MELAFINKEDFATLHFILIIALLHWFIEKLDAHLSGLCLHILWSGVRLRFYLCAGIVLEFWFPFAGKALEFICVWVVHICMLDGYIICLADFGRCIGGTW